MISLEKVYLGHVGTFLLLHHKVIQNLDVSDDKSYHAIIQKPHNRPATYQLGVQSLTVGKLDVVLRVRVYYCPANDSQTGKEMVATSVGLQVPGAGWGWRACCFRPTWRGRLLLLLMCHNLFLLLLLLVCHNLYLLLFLFITHNLFLLLCPAPTHPASIAFLLSTSSLILSLLARLLLGETFFS